MRLNNECNCKDCSNVPAVVEESISHYFRRDAKTDPYWSEKVLNYRKKLEFDHIMKCYHFNFAGMFIGVEKDGYLHS